VVAPDLAGFGRSDKPRLDYDRAFHLANLDEVVTRFAGVGPIVVVGHSLGGVFATLWAAAHAERVRALVLAAVPYPAGDGPPEWARRGPPAAFRAAARVARATWPVVGVPIGVARGYPPGVVMDFGRQRIHSRVNTMASALWEPSVAEGLEPARTLLAPVPVLLANARDDRTVPLGDQDRWAALLPHAERVVLDEGGHQFPLRTDFETIAAWLRAGPER
jgi:pimeloyl-ACP methyl ester carboxylesterase